MMLVVPLSSCITDDTFSSNTSSTLAGEFPKEPETPVTPGNYKIIYHSGSYEREFEYNGTFAYAARLPDGWTAPDGKVFAGWSNNLNSEGADAPSGENASSSTVDYQVYDDIEYDTNGMPKDASSGVLNLYAVWTVANSDHLYEVYVNANTTVTTQNGYKDTPFKTLSKAYAQLNPNGTTTTNRIIVIGDYEITNNDVNGELNLWDGETKKPATICGLDANSKLSFNTSGINVSVILRADTVFENITFDGDCVQAFIYCYRHNLTMGEGIKSADVGSMNGAMKKTYAIPDGYPAFTILGGGHGKDTSLNADDIIPNSNILNSSEHENNELTIKLISGKYGRVSGFGRGYDSVNTNNFVETVCPTLTIYGSTDIGTLAGGHLDGDATTGVNSNDTTSTAAGNPATFKTAKIFVKSTLDFTDDPNNTNKTVSPHIVNLVGGNIGNNEKSILIGNVEISIFDGTIDNIYGAGLGRKLNNTEVLPQTSMSGEVTIYLCGGKVTNNLYGGGAAAALSSEFAKGINPNININSKTKVIINGGIVKGNVYGGGYGYSEYINTNFYMVGGNQLSAGTVVGDTYVAVLKGTIGTEDENNVTGGNVFGGGKGADHTDDSASITGDMTVAIFGGSIFRSVYGGGEGIDSKEKVAEVTGSTSVYVSDGTISGNVYGGGSIASVGGSTSVTIAGGTIGGTTDGGRVFGGGEGNLTSDWAGLVAGSTEVTISKGVIKGSVYGGGNYGVVGSTSKTSSTTVHIGPDELSSYFDNSSIQIAGSVYGGGRGDESDIDLDKYQNPSNKSEIPNGVTKGNVYGDTNVTVSRGKIGYYDNNGEIIDPTKIWYDSESAGSVFGGGKLGLVTGTTDVTISGGEIHRNVYGGGKGLSKSVFIELSGDGSEISSRLYNLLALDLSPEDKESITGAIGSNLNYVTEYVWESSSDPDSGFKRIVGQEESSISKSDVTQGHSYVRLTVYAENDTIGKEGIFSNVICINPNTNSGYTNKTEDKWYLENREMVQFGAVVGGTSVTVTGGNIHTNVYGGGSYAVVGTITGENIKGENIPPSETSSETLSDTDSTTYNFKHKLSGGETSVTIQGGTIGFDITGPDTHPTHPNSNIGNIFGGGMGEPDMITAGAVGGSASVIIDKGTVRGNVYGGGANGFVGPVTIEISDTMSEISASSGGIGTWSYNLNIVKNSESEGSEATPGATSVTVNSGTIGYSLSELNGKSPEDYSAEEHGNIFGAGMGGNATVTGSGKVKLNATGQITIYGNVYGGGELGIVGQLTGHGTGESLKLTGGSSSVEISENSAQSISINGSVFGGGKGRFTTSPSDAILGAVGGKSSVAISSSNDSSVTISGNVFGGGELSIVGSYDKIGDEENNAQYTFKGGAASVNISNGTISGNVYGGGEGDPRNIVSGATGSTTVIISGSTLVEKNVYGGGAYGLVGKSVTTTLYENSHPITDSNNAASSTVVILGGTVKEDVFGGGYGPNATIGGSTYVFIGKLTSNFHFPSDANSDQLDIIIHGNVYGGGEMGPVGFFYNDVLLGNVQLSSNVMITSNSKSIKIDGNVYGGGKGWDLALIYKDNTKKEISKIQALMPGEKPSISGTEPYDILSGYAIVYGNTVVNISGSGITIDKCVYGGGEGVLRSGSIILTDGNHKGEIDYKEVLASLPYGQVTGNDSEGASSKGASVTITDAKVHENVYGGGNTGLIGTYTKTADGAADKVFTIGYSGKPVSVIIDGAEIGVTDASGHTESGGDDITSGNVFGAGKGNDEGILLGAVGSSTVEIKGNAHIVKVTKLGSQTLDNLTDADNKTVLERAIALSGNVYGGGDYGIVGNSVTVKVNLNHNYNTADNANHTSGYDPFKAHYVDSYSTTKDIVTVSISGTSQIDGNVYGGGKGTFDSHGSNGEVDLGDDELIKPTMSAGYGTVYGSVKVTMSEGTVSGNVYGGGKGSLNETGENKDKNQNILHSIPYGQITGLDSSRMPAPAGTEQLSTSSIAASVFISGGTVEGSVFGGGQLGILGTFNKDTRYFDGKDSLVVIFSDIGEVKINSSVFGGGEGAASSSVSGAVRDTTVIIGKGALIGKDAASGEDDYSEETIDGTTLRLYYGNVYGGGKLSITGSATVKNNDAAKLEQSSNEHKDNSSNANVIILGGEIKRNVYGGGFSPKASIAGNTHVWIGKYTSTGDAVSPNISGSLAHVGYSQGEGNLKINIKISGSVYGGGEMGSVGTSLIDLDDPSSFDTSDTGKNPNGQELVSANVSIKYDSSSITIGDLSHTDKNGSLLDGVFGGGEGIQNYGSGDDIEVSGIKGYAIVRGSAYVEIERDPENNSNLTINGSVFGGGRGAQYNVESIHYAEVYDSAAVKVSNADVKGDVFGGGKLSIIGHFYDAYPTEDTQVSWFKKDGTKTDTYHVNIDKTDGKAYLVDDSGSYITVENGLIATTIDSNKRLLVTYRYFCSDSAEGEGGTIQTTKNIPQYAGKGTAAVLINDSNIEGNVYGGGEGVETNILAGAVGRGTVVTIDDSPNDNSKTEINGNVYGGGKLGIVGSVMTEIIGTGGIGTNSFSTTKVSHTVHSYKPSGESLNPTDINSANDIDLIVNIFGGHIKGSVFGAGKGEQVCYEGVPYPEKDRISYYKLSVFGRTEVNISDGRIDKHVYGGSENGETGSLTVLKSVKKFADGYWDTNPYNDYRRGAPSDIPKTVRDNGYTKVDGSEASSTLPSFNAAFVNIVGGTIYGNVFGGGYFGAVHGDTHVHIGWNAMMPDGDTKGDCHFYNDYSDKDENGNTVFRQGGHLPFVERSKNIEDLGDVVSDNDSKPKSLTKESTVHNLFINGTVYAGGDRGDPSAVTVNYDYISVYGTSHIFVNGEGYTTGTDTPKDNKKAMYIQGSLFGSGNSCTTFYSDKSDTRFIIIRNYDAVNDDKLNNFIIYSIQRATEVTLVNSSLRLPGRSDGSNADKGALYSINHVNCLYLRSSSELVLDTIVQDLRSMSSYATSSDNEITSAGSAVNTIKLNNGITLTIKTEENPDVSASQDLLSDINNTLWRDGEFGIVSGYFFLDLDDPLYYTSYVYGSQDSAEQGGFIYGGSFEERFIGREISHEDFDNEDGENYRAWHPVGGGHLSASSTIVANKNVPAPGENGTYLNTGKIILPMTAAGSKYTLIGYNIYPAQSSGLDDKDPSLQLIDESASFGNDVNKVFKLKAGLGNGFDNIEGSDIWIAPGNEQSLVNKSFVAVGGAVLPEIKLELYSNGVTQTTTAGYVVLLIQESILVDNENGDPEYVPGNEISAVINIETQADGFGAKEGGEENNYTNNMNLYATRDGYDDWNLSISNIDEGKYRFTLTDISDENHLLTKNDPASKDEYKIIMRHNQNNDNSTGWDGFSFDDINLKAALDQFDSGGILLGETDGRFNTSFKFVINNVISEGGMEGYASGEIILTIKYEKISAKTSSAPGPSAGTEVLSAGTDVENDPDANDSGTIQIVIEVGQKKDWYNVKFVTAPGEENPGVGAIPTQKVTYGKTALRPDDPSRIDGKYTFEGWYRVYESPSTDGNETYADPYSFNSGEQSAKILNDTILYGKWVSAVTFNYNYDESDVDYSSCPSPVTIKLNAKTGALNDSMPENPFRAGYTFSGWNTATDGNESGFTSSTSVSQNTTVYAVWTPLTYNITFNANLPSGFGNTGITLPSVIPDAQATVTLTEPSPKQLKSNNDPNISYNFVGWGTSPEALTGHIRDTALSDLIANNTTEEEDGSVTITLYAVWQESTMHTVKITADPATAERYILFEYYIGESTPGEDSPWQKVTGGAFSVEDNSTAHIRYSINGDSSLYSFNNWSYKLNGANTSASENLTLSNISDDLQVTLSLTGKSITVNLNLDGGTLTDPDGKSVPSITVTFGGTYTGLDNPEKLGYSFAGWYDDKQNGSKVTPATEVTNPASPQTLYAKWDPITYNILYYENGADNHKTSYQNVSGYKSGMKVNLSTYTALNFNYNNKLFLNWNTEFDGSGTSYGENESLEINDNLINSAQSVSGINNVILTLYAQWTDSDLAVTLSDSTKTFNGYDWRSKFAFDNDNTKIKISATHDGTPVTLSSSNCTISWKDSHGDEISSSGMVNVGTYTLEVTYTDVENTYKGSVEFSITPYTGKILIDDIGNYTYNGSVPNLLGTITAYIDNNGNRSYSEGVDYKLKPSDLDNFDISYFEIRPDQPQNLNDAPVVAGDYRFTLTAKENSLNYCDPAQNESASGTQLYNIVTKDLEITIGGSVRYSGEASFNHLEYSTITVTSNDLCNGDMISNAVITTSSANVGDYAGISGDKYLSLVSSTIKHGGEDRTSCYNVLISENSKISINSLITLNGPTVNLISFNYKIDDGDEISYTDAFELSPDEAVTITAAGTKEGHHIVFSPDPESAGTSDKNQYTITGNTLTKNVTVTASWAPDQYNLTVSGAANGSITVTENDTPLQPDQQTGRYSITYGEEIKITYSSSNGYRATAWSADLEIVINTSSSTASFTAPDYDITITVIESNQYTVAFDSTGGSSVDPKSVEYNKTVSKPTPDPTRPGYTFKGWYKADGTEWNFETDTVTADITLYAKWEPKDTPTPTRYNVKYDANGGEGEVPEAELHFAGEFVTVKSADLSRFGYDFKGWCDSLTQTTYQAEDTFRMPSRDVCLTAVWDKQPIQGKEVTVTFIVDSEVYSRSSTHINTILNGAMPSDPVKEGFDFLGWYTKDREIFTSETVVKDDMTVYAKFELNEDYVLVTYIIDKEVYMTLACKKSMITEPNVSAGIGKELNGWYTDEELKNKFDFNTTIKEDFLTLYAEWKDSPNFMVWFIFILFAFFIAAVIASAKKVSFYKDENDEERYASVVMIGRGALGDKFPQSPDNKNFSGWYSEEGELITAETEIKHSMKLYARWKD